MRTVFPQVTPRLEELRLFRLQQESKSAEDSENNPKRNARDKRKLGPEITGEQPTSKRQRDAGRNSKKASEENKDQMQNSSQGTTVEGINQKNNKSDDNLSEQQLTLGKNREYSDQCTAFISNIHPMVNSALGLSLSLSLSLWVCD